MSSPEREPDATIYVEIFLNNDGLTADMGIGTSGRVELTVTQVVKSLRFALAKLEIQYYGQEGEQLYDS